MDLSFFVVQGLRVLPDRCCLRVSPQRPSGLATGIFDAFPFPRAAINRHRPD